MTSRQRFGAVALLWALLAAWPGTAAAQTGAASITGLVTDESGAAVPGVTVTATNQATNVAYTAVSNDAGNYTITSLPVGTYVVKAELTGFRTTTRTPLTFEAQQVARLDFKMSVGAVAGDASRSSARRRFCRPRPRRSAKSSPATPRSRCRSTAATPASSRCSCRAP